MYELSLLAIVADKDVPRACNVLSTLCAQDPWETIHHVHFFRGSGRPSGMANPSPTPTPQQKDVPALWKELDQALGRQSYHIQVRYEVAKGDFGNGIPTDFNAVPATLRWTDFPEPPQAVGQQERGLITQRKKIEIWGQKNLYKILIGKQYGLISDQIEQAYLFFRDDVEFTLHRHSYPQHPSVSPTIPANPLPPWSGIVDVDDMHHWLLQVKMHVIQDNKPDEVRKAQERLLAIKKELDGIFQFEVVDRQVYDSRVPLQAQGAPAPLPQVVRAHD